MVRKKQQLQIKKVICPEGVPSQILRECVTGLAPILTHIFLHYASAKMYPTSWKHAVDHHIPTKGDKSNPFNYSPIDLCEGLSIHSYSLSEIYFFSFW